MQSQPQSRVTTSLLSNGVLSKTSQTQLASLHPLRHSLGLNVKGKCNFKQMLFKLVENQTVSEKQKDCSAQLIHLNEFSNQQNSQNLYSGKQNKILPVFKEFHSDLAAERISTKDDESDYEFDKLMNEINNNLMNNLICSSSNEVSQQQTPFKSPQRKLHSCNSSEQLINNNEVAMHEITQRTVSNFLKIAKVPNIQKLKNLAHSYGKVLYCDQHFLNKEDVIIKYEKIEEALHAYNNLSQMYWVSFIEAQHAYDESKPQHQTQKNDEQSDASLTLNMLKLKQESSGQFSRNPSSQKYNPQNAINNNGDKTREQHFFNDLQHDQLINHQSLQLIQRAQSQKYEQTSSSQNNSSENYKQDYSYFNVNQNKIFQKNNLQNNVHYQGNCLTTSSYPPSQVYYMNQLPPQGSYSTKLCFDQQSQAIGQYHGTSQQQQDLRVTNSNNLIVHPHFEYKQQISPQVSINTSCFVPQSMMQMQGTYPFQQNSNYQTQFQQQPPYTSRSDGYQWNQQQWNQFQNHQQYASSFVESSFSSEIQAQDNSKTSQFQDELEEKQHYQQFKMNNQSSSLYADQCQIEQTNKEQQIRMSKTSSTEKGSIAQQTIFNQERGINKSVTYSSDSRSQEKSDSNSKNINCMNNQMSTEQLQQFNQNTQEKVFQFKIIDEKERFKLNLNDIINLKDMRTTIMIKNIPNKYTQKMLLQKINENHKDKYDFFYLPIDFKNKCNVGYAFINFVDSIFILKFFEEFNGKKWECFNSEKICELTYGRIQSKTSLIDHFEQTSSFNQTDRKVKPLILTVPPPNPSFLKDYRKNLLLKFGKDIGLKFKKRTYSNEESGSSNSESNRNQNENFQFNESPRIVQIKKQKAFYKNESNPTTNQFYNKK